MKVRTPKFSTVVVLSLLASVMTSGICSSQAYGRQGKFEFYGIFQGRDTLQAESTDYGRELRIDGGPTTGGFGFGYNFNNNLNVNTSFLFSTSDIELRTLSGSLIGEADTDIFLFNVNLDYNVLTDPFTPFVTGGLGSANFDGTFDTGLPFDETDFSWNLGAGLRWDISDKWLIKAAYISTWLEIEDTDDPSRFDGGSFSLAYKF